MAVNSISTLMAPTTNQQVNTNAPGTEKDMFLKLLVAQLKNQDPLAPQDGTAFVAQLAQFNSLDQLMAIRQAMDALNTNLTSTKRDVNEDLK